MDRTYSPNKTVFRHLRIPVTLSLRTSRTEISRALGLQLSKPVGRRNKDGILDNTNRSGSKPNIIEKSKCPF